MLNKIKKIFNSSKLFNWVVVSLVFLLLFLILFFVNNINKVLIIYNDEFYYLELAKSIYYGHGLSMHNLPTGFQKILYPLVIAPCFAISNAATRLTVITLVNSLLLSSSIFPLYLIGKRIGLKPSSQYILLAFGCFSPILVFVVSYMAEVLYYPMSLWLVYLWLLNKDKRSWIIAIGGGILCYALYLCKETALITFGIFVGISIIYPLVGALNNQLPFRSTFHKKDLINSGIFIVTFFALFFTFKFTIFRNLGSSYDQTDPSAIDSVQKFFYVIYAFLFCVSGISFTALFLPIVYPFFCYKKMNRNCQHLFLFAFLMLIVVSFHIAYAVSVREDYIGNPSTPRVIIRYMCPAMICFVAIMLYILDNRKAFLTNLSPLQKKKLWIMLGSLLLLFVIVNKSGYIDCVATGVPLMPYYLFYELFAKFIAINKAAYYALYIILNLAIATLILLFNWLIIDKKKGKSFSLIAGGLAFVSLFSSFVYMEVNFLPKYKINEEETAALVKINDFVHSLGKDEKILWETNRQLYQMRTIDTYVDQMEHIVAVNASVLENTVMDIHRNAFKVNETIFEDVYFEKNYPVFNQINYIFIHEEIVHFRFTWENLELMEEYSNSYFKVYRNLEPTTLHVRFAYSD